MKSLFAVCFSLVFLTAADAKIWVVAQDGSGDFTEIQPAHDVASDNDVIVVREGVYKGVWIKKPITIVGAGIDRTTITQISGPINFSIFILDFPQGTVHLASFSAESQGPIVVLNSAGQTIVHDTKLSGTVAFVVRDSALFFGQRVIQPPSTGRSTGENGMVTSNNVEAFSLSQASFEGQRGLYSGCASIGYPGQQGIQLFGGGSYYLSNVSAKGGDGGEGCYDRIYCIPWPGGPGGDGLRAEGVQVLVGGTAEDVFRGGMGGDGEFASICSDTSPGGDGGNGIHDVGGSTVTTFGVTAQGGVHGSGNPPGKDGKPTVGNVVPIQQLPTCKMLGDAALGGTFTFEFHGPEGDQLILLFSSMAGHAALPGSEGFPLFVVPGGAFAAVPLGAFDATGVKAIPINVPNDPDLRGAAGFVQGVVLSPSGAHKPQLTNVSFAIVKEP